MTREKRLLEKKISKTVLRWNAKNKLINKIFMVASIKKPKMKLFYQWQQIKQSREITSSKAKYQQYIQVPEIFQNALSCN